MTGKGEGKWYSMSLFIFWYLWKLESDVQYMTSVLRVAEDPCGVYMSHGEGEEELLRWYFNVEQHFCTPFVYRGRKGNENNFVTKQLCERACESGEQKHTCFANLLCLGHSMTTRCAIKLKMCFGNWEIKKKKKKTGIFILQDRQSLWPHWACFSKLRGCFRLRSSFSGISVT